MSQKTIPFREFLGNLEQLIDSKKPSHVVDWLKSVTDEDTRRKLCFLTITHYGQNIALDTGRAIVIYNHKEDYEEALAGRGDCSPDSVLYSDNKNRIHGLETFIDFVPRNDPLKRYWKSIKD